MTDQPPRFVTIPPVAAELAISEAQINALVRRSRESVRKGKSRNDRSGACSTAVALALLALCLASARPSSSDTAS